MEKEWTMIIRPQEKLWKVNLGEIWAYRDLIELFVKRNIVVQYKQTILGPAWYVVQPALTVIMYMIVFGGIQFQFMVWSIIILGLVSTFYTMMGGIKGLLSA